VNGAGVNGAEVNGAEVNGAETTAIAHTKQGSGQSSGERVFPR